VHTTLTGRLTIGSGGILGAISVEVKITVFGTSCYYGTGAGTTLGTLVGGAPATLKVNTVVNEQEPQSFLCLNDARWEATFTVTSPSSLYVGA
jgi:hypothetical protein